jgi:hypothetical protein
MKPKGRKITTLLLGSAQCSESKLSRLIPDLRHATVIGFFAMVCCCWPCFAQDLVANGGFATANVTTSFPMTFGTGSPYAPAYWTFSPSHGQIGIGCVTSLFSTLSQTDACGPNLGNSLWPGWTFSPNGGNFVLIDGDPGYAGILSQQVSVTGGQFYEVSFYQAASQFMHFNGPTTEQWEVCLGAQCEFSTLMNNASHGFVPWESQTLTFTAATTGYEILSFLAVGTPGGEPPVVLLDGVSMVKAGTTPEPGKAAGPAGAKGMGGGPIPLTLMTGGLGGLGVFRSRKWLKR